MYGNRSNDLEDRNRQVVLDGRAVLERTGQSLDRSHQIAVETEAVGTEVISELSSQRETLLRAQGRLRNTDENLDSTRNVLRKMGRSVVYNKLILILIILIEIGILVAISYIKFIKK